MFKSTVGGERLKFPSIGGIFPRLRFVFFSSAEKFDLIWPSAPFPFDQWHQFSRWPASRGPWSATRSIRFHASAPIFRWRLSRGSLAGTLSGSRPPVGCENEWDMHGSAEHSAWHRGALGSGSSWPLFPLFWALIFVVVPGSLPVT